MTSARGRSKIVGMTNEDDQNKPATKHDLLMLKKGLAELKAANKQDLIILEERIAKLFSDGLQLIADQFDKQNKVMATKTDIKDLRRDLTKAKTATQTNASTLKKLKRALA
jgi:hypothetical protein